MVEIMPERCIKCFACLTTCENNVIYSKGIDVFVDQNKKRICSACSRKCKTFCPTAAIID